ncbi:hypothetical protein PRIPAC_74562 [Pristionchus pacificus]|uniref:Uncharacterized protein n=1 Tax=Pristionchus pacificus TaxID=54126 RepID=A0A2A6CRC0_PRIPA|nr:hypothetical protein PRIPAC_74562 [Pristionchus pacificus]|eukprot:PDM80593.1 hypothetical protein PRIPAC_35596 [Pristionchus pacificus]
MERAVWLRIGQIRRDLAQLKNLDYLKRNTRKTVFDVTSSGANGRSTCKMKLPIVISTVENPKTHHEDERDDYLLFVTFVLFPLMDENEGGKEIRDEEGGPEST